MCTCTLSGVLAKCADTFKSQTKLLNSIPTGVRIYICKVHNMSLMTIVSNFYIIMTTIHMTVFHSSLLVNKTENLLLLICLSVVRINYRLNILDILGTQLGCSFRLNEVFADKQCDDFNVVYQMAT